MKRARAWPAAGTIAGCVNDLELGIGALELETRSNAHHPAGHDHVGEQEVDAGGLRLRQVSNAAGPERADRTR